MSICPQCGKTVQSGVALCPYCKVNMRALRRSELMRPGNGAPPQPRPVSHQKPVHERKSSRSAPERKPGPDGLSLGKITGFLITSGFHR